MPERLDFRQKKAALDGESPRHSRMPPSFSYGKVRACCLYPGIRQEVDIHRVNPAFSSVFPGESPGSSRLALLGQQSI